MYRKAQVEGMRDLQCCCCVEDELGPEDSESQKAAALLSIQAKARGGVQLRWWQIDGISQRSKEKTHQWVGLGSGLSRIVDGRTSNTSLY